MSPVGNYRFEVDAIFDLDVSRVPLIKKARKSTMLIAIIFTAVAIFVFFGMCLLKTAAPQNINDQYLDDLDQIRYLENYRKERDMSRK